MKRQPGGAGASPTYKIDMTLEYGYNEMNNRTFEKVSEHGVYDPARSRVYTYDSLQRLVRADYESDLSLVTAGDRINPASYPSATGKYEIFNLNDVNNRTTVVTAASTTTYSSSAVTPEPADLQMNQYTAKSNPTVTAENRNFTYDKNGNRLSAFNPVTGITETWDYDFKNRPINFKRLAGMTVLFHERYEYDAFSHRIKRTRVISGSLLAEGFEGGILEEGILECQPLSGQPISGELELLTGGEGPACDDPVKPAEPDAGDGLGIPAGQGGGSSSLGGGGKRGAPQNGPYPVLYYYYDNWKLTETRGGDEHVVSIYSNAFGVPGLPGGPMSGPYHVFGATDYANESGYHFIRWEDAHGSSRALTFDTNFNGNPGFLLGTIEEYTDYTAFGMPQIRQSGTITNPPSYSVLTADQDPFSWNLTQFNGHVFDFATDLHQIRYRYMDSTVGQFIQNDPSGTWYDRDAFGNGKDGLGSNPINRIDHLGLDSETINGMEVEFENCDENEKASLRDAIKEGKAALDRARLGLRPAAHPDTSTDVEKTAETQGVKKHFGSSDADTAEDVYEKIRDTQKGVENHKTKYVCEDCCPPFFLAYTYWSLFDALPYFDDNVHICPDFFNQSGTTQATTVVHEWTHTWAWTYDWAYDYQPEYATLSKWKRKNNADNYTEYVKDHLQNPDLWKEQSK